MNHFGKLRSMTAVYFESPSGLACLYRIGSRVADRLYVGAAGGHLEPDEVSDARKCVLREMQEELGLGLQDVENLRLRYVTIRLKDGELRQNFYFFARLKTEITLSSTEGILRWADYEELKTLPMPASARYMMDHYLSTGRFDEILYAGIAGPGGADFVPLEEF